jgi:hypothetical protein
VTVANDDAEETAELKEVAAEAKEVIVGGGTQRLRVQSLLQQQCSHGLYICFTSCG